MVLMSSGGDDGVWVLMQGSGGAGVQWGDDGVEGDDESGVEWCSSMSVLCHLFRSC